MKIKECTAEKGEKFITPLAPRKSLGEHFREFAAEKKYLLLCFFVPLGIMGLLYLCMSVYHGGECVLVLDLNGQYVYFFEALRSFLHGDGSLLYSFGRALGGDFIGIFAYYLSSPFSLLVAIFPKENITEALLTILLLKTGCCGLTFGIYLEATRKERNRTAAVIFSVMYALCGYCVVMQHNTMWFDNVIFLPLIMLGIEQLVRHGKFGLYTFALTWAVISNFYIGYMSCIFAAVYFVYYMLSSSPDERNPRGERLHSLKAFGRMALYSLISVTICAALIFGTYYSLTLGKTTFSNPNYSPTQRFDWMDILPKFLIGSYDTVRPEGLPFVYCGTLMLILAPLYFFAPHVKPRKKIASGCLIAFFLVSFNVSTIDLFWHGMQKPNWLNYRYSYMLCFFLILFAYTAFVRLREIGYRKAVGVCGIISLMLLVIQKQGYDNANTFSTIWLSLAIIGIYLCVLWAVCAEGEERRQTASLVLALLVGTEMFGGGLMNMSSLDDDVRYSLSSGYRSFIDGLTPVVESIKADDDSFYRMEKNHHRKTNDNLALGIRGLSNSTSTLNSETISLLHDFGLSSKSHWSKYLGGTPVSDSLFGIKYIIADNTRDEIFEEYEVTELGDDDYTVYRNPYALAPIFTVDPMLEELNIHDDFASPFTRMNEIVSAMLGIENGVHIFKNAVYAADINPGSMQTSTVAGHTKYEKTESGFQRVTFSVRITSEDVLYCYFPTDYLRESYLYVNGLKQGSVFGNETDRIIELGSFEVGDTVEIALEPLDDCVYIKNNESYFCYLNSEDFEKYMPRLLEGQMEIDSFTESSFKGSITAENGRLLVCTSIPYDEGWNISVDGVRAEPVKLCGGLLGFYVEEGEHALTLNYFPRALTYGLIVQVVGIAALVACIVITEKRRKKLIAMGVPVYCEEFGEALPDEVAFETALTEAKTEEGQSTEHTENDENVQPSLAEPGEKVSDEKEENE